MYAKKSLDWPVEKQAETQAWIAWALEQADRKDPFVVEKPRSVLDRKQEVVGRIEARTSLFPILGCSKSRAMRLYSNPR
ncbi:MAG: hypothetical protein WA354_20960 [Terracidiphilus sp.]